MIEVTVNIAEAKKHFSELLGQEGFWLKAYFYRKETDMPVIYETIAKIDEKGQ